MRTPRQFVDEATITVKAGDGGNGITSFLREKYRPKGGPAGGDGGRGGDVFLKVSTNLITLEDFRQQRHFKAGRGTDGQGRNKAGKAGKELVILVPPGTIAVDADTLEVVADMSRKGDKVLVAKGGIGGLGNQHFATATNRVPTKSTPGQPGEERTLLLELRLLADVGLVGFPNAGKSTFLNRVSNAKPRIANYPFTTLRPSVGIVKVGDFHQFTMADIPGLIAEAHAGKGLGHQFLRHIARTRLLCHLIEVRPDSLDNLAPLVEEYQTILAELAAWDSEDLLAKPRVTVLNKIDLLTDPAQSDELMAAFRAATGCDTALYCTSTQTGEGLVPLVLDLLALVSEGQPNPHAGLEVRYELPAAHLNIRQVSHSDRWWEEVPGQRAEDLEDEPENYLTTESGEVVPFAGPRKSGDEG